MKSWKAWILAAGMLFLGRSLGCTYVMKQMKVVISAVGDLYDVGQETNAAEVTLNALRLLRAQNVEAASEVLEARLDAAVLALQYSAKDGAEDYKMMAAESLYDIRDYRARFPRKFPNPVIQASVQKALNASLSATEERELQEFKEERKNSERKHSSVQGR